MQRFIVRIVIETSRLQLKLQDFNQNFKTSTKYFDSPKDQNSLLIKTIEGQKVKKKKKVIEDHWVKKRIN